MMRSTYRKLALGFLTAGALSIAGPARGQHADSALLYGEGVNAYFNGSCYRAEQYLSGALDADSQDPRPYYFRALSLLRLGRIAEARGDMMVGAALEAQRPNRFAVGEALIRVQGQDRLLLEKFRRQARIEAAGGASANLPYSARESAVQRTQVVIPLEEYLRPGIPRAAAPTATAPPPRTFAPSSELTAPGDPFRDDPRPPATRPPVLPPAPTQPAPSDSPTTDSEDPFREAAEDTTSDEAATPAPSTPDAEAPPVAEDEDPFSDL